jgi:hypothetical protein
MFLPDEGKLSVNKDVDLPEMQVSYTGVMA